MSEPTVALSDLAHYRHRFASYADSPTVTLTAATAIGTTQPSIADELEKPASLRERAIITAEEFEVQKRHLLG